MSEHEKRLQIGLAVERYQQAKVEAAHLEAKLARTFQAFRRVGELGGHVPAQVVEGRLSFPTTREKFDATDLCNEWTLVTLLLERNEALATLAAAKKDMTALGLGGIE